MARILCWSAPGPGAPFKGGATWTQKKPHLTLARGEAAKCQTSCGVNWQRSACFKGQVRQLQFVVADAPSTFLGGYFLNVLKCFLMQVWNRHRWLLSAPSCIRRSARPRNCPEAKSSETSCSSGRWLKAGMTSGRCRQCSGRKGAFPSAPTARAPSRRNSFRN